MEAPQATEALQEGATAAAAAAGGAFASAAICVATPAEAGGQAGTLMIREAHEVAVVPSEQLEDMVMEVRILRRRTLVSLAAARLAAAGLHRLQTSLR